MQTGETYNPPSTLLSTSLKLAALTQDPSLKPPALAWARFQARGTSSSCSS